MFINMCDDKSLNGSETNLIFNQSTDTARQNKSCVCETTAGDGDQVKIDYIDVRMIRAHSETGTESLCSSAVLNLKRESDSLDFLECNKSLSNENNLHYNFSLNESGTLKFTLDNLYVEGENDSPVMVWLRLRGKTIYF